LTRKPTTAAGYAPELAEEARSLCLYIATILGDLWDDVIVVGGLVPYLIVDQQRGDVRRHVGTRDLDLGLRRCVGAPGHAHVVAGPVQVVVGRRRVAGVARYGTGLSTS